ncbi:hypothetical protein [Sphingomonas sp.]|uniref:hypothetical protein n=1 Tax=Sphingomonas sp. TaxID=28214 RepID=UPI001820E566|nr:hypothetical protein [Sphingomonas sp.]MBA4760446.1 hypothetical protein [Sphingomonas sp.]
MKRLILAAILLGTAGCGGDPATRVIDGIEASYSKEGRLDAITINFDDDGNARLWAGKRRGIIVRDGQDYLMNERRVAIDKTKYKMEPVAALRGDVMAALSALADAQRKRVEQAEAAAKASGELRPDGTRVVRLYDGREMLITPPPVVTFQVVPVGTEEVGGRSGKVWRLSAVGDPRPNGLEAVMSSDPELAQVGRLIRMHMAPADVAALEPEGTRRNLAKAAAELFGKGTLLRLSVRGEAGQTMELYRLQRFGPASFRGAVLMLPATVRDRKTLREDLKVLTPVEDDSPMRGVRH